MQIDKVASEIFAAAFDKIRNIIQNILVVGSGIGFPLFVISSLMMYKSNISELLNARKHQVSQLKRR